MKSDQWSYRDSRDYESNLAKIRCEEGYTLKKLSKETDICIGTLSKFQNGMVSPIAGTIKTGKFKGDIKYQVNKLAKILNSTIAELFPRYICDIERNKYLDNDQILAITCGQYTAQNYTYYDRDRIDKLKKLLKRLMPRELFILKKRFIEGYTLEEIGKRIGVQKERVRQIEGRALRKLRHEAHYSGLLT